MNCLKIVLTNSRSHFHMFGAVITPGKLMLLIVASLEAFFTSDTATFFFSGVIYSTPPLNSATGQSFNVCS